MDECLGNPEDADSVIALYIQQYVRYETQKEVHHVRDTTYSSVYRHLRTERSPPSSRPRIRAVIPRRDRIMQFISKR